ncbi:thioredoxin domain-containing protein [Yokenella regensburgei]|uniref:thioredoxin domain-containing protein n=1 Tax=Yokenella regensburgei TaxID=158877 RepID=UPI003ED84DC8
MRYFTLILLLCVSAFSVAAEPASSGEDQLASLLFNDQTNPRIGAEKPKLVIVSFTDYNCPYCKQFDPMLEKIVHDNPQVQLIVKLLPFKGESSMASAQVALTAWRQAPDKFWALHQRLMSKKGYHDAASIAAAQAKTGTSDIKPDDKSRDSVQMNLILSQVLGLQGTPATIIGDQMVAGAIPYNDLEALVKEQLAKANAQ